MSDGIYDAKAAGILQEFARTRSHQDVAVANDLAKVLVQSLILINGGAVAAILSFYGSSKIPLNALNKWSLAFYVCGVMWAVLAGVGLMRMAQSWSEHWEQKFYRTHGSEIEAQRRFDSAKSFRWRAYLALLFGTIFFALGSATMAIAI